MHGFDIFNTPSSLKYVSPTAATAVCTAVVSARFPWPRSDRVIQPIVAVAVVVSGWARLACWVRLGQLASPGLPDATVHKPVKCPRSVFARSITGPDLI